MKTTVVVESLSSFKTNVLFQRIPTFFKRNIYAFRDYKEKRILQNIKGILMVKKS